MPLLERKRQLISLLKAEQLKDSKKVDNFKPNKAQAPFLASNARIKAFLASNKLGKTASGVIWALKQAFVGGKVGKVISGLGFDKGIRDVIYPEIMKWLPKDRFISEKKNSLGIVVRMVVRGDNGKPSVLIFMSSEQDAKTFEGDLSDFAWIDEPVPREIYFATLRGLLVSNGPLIFTLTPLSEPWIYEEIFCSDDPEIECFQGSIYDASIENGGHLTAESIRSFVSKIPADERGPRVYGEFKHLLGRVYKTFSKEIHVIEPFKVPKSWPVYCSIDPHLGKPNAALWVAVSPDEVWYIVNEVWWGAGIEQFGHHVREISRQYSVVKTLIDTSSETQDWRRRDTARTILEHECKIKLTLARKKNQKESSRMIISQALEGLHGIKNVPPAPWLYCFKSCRRTIVEFMNHVWDTDVNDNTTKDKVKKIYDDMLDNLGYIVIESPKYRRAEILTTRSYSDTNG